MRLAAIASGSTGNCIYVGSEHCNLLLDAGISLKRMEAGLRQLGLTPADLDGILITHEHSDHVSGLGPLLRKYDIPLYTSEGTLDALCHMSALGSRPAECGRYITSASEFEIGDMTINAMEVSHDAAQPFMYRFSAEGRDLAVATDLGVVTDQVISFLKGLDGMLIEANHDVRMLQVGPYPYHLKQRILGDRGHISNETSGRLLNAIRHDGLKKVLLGHLSKTNNYPELALETVRLELSLGANGAPMPELAIAPPSGLSDIIEI